MHARLTQRAALFRQACRIHAHREIDTVGGATAEQVAGGAGHVPRAAEDGVEEQHLAQAELGRDHQRRRLQRLEPAGGDDALERPVEVLVGRHRGRRDRAGEATPQQRLGKPKRPHHGSPSTGSVLRASLTRNSRHGHGLRGVPVTPLPRHAHRTRSGHPRSCPAARKHVDGRNKCGHDELGDCESVQKPREPDVSPKQRSPWRASWRRGSPRPSDGRRGRGGRRGRDARRRRRSPPRSR